VAPGNVLVRDDGAISLIDFGIATSRWRDAPERGVLRGTRGYMAPEVVTGEGTIDGRSDVFVAAVLLYEMLTGRRLYAGGATEVMLAIAEGAGAVRARGRRVGPGVARRAARALPGQGPRGAAHGERGAGAAVAGSLSEGPQPGATVAINRLNPSATTRPSSSASSAP
jgi:serine/threonine protein kinase